MEVKYIATWGVDGDVFSMALLNTDTLCIEYTLRSREIHDFDILPDHIPVIAVRSLSPPCKYVDFRPVFRDRVYSASGRLLGARAMSILSGIPYTDEASVLASVIAKTLQKKMISVEDLLGAR